MNGSRLVRTFQKTILIGKSFQEQKTEAITHEQTGAETAGTITALDESPLSQSLLWVGTDDGNVQLTHDDGSHWINLTENIKGISKDLRVSSIVASRFSKGRAYITFDGHYLNDFNTYVYTTDDYGKTWTNLNANLPAREPCHVIKEGLKNPDLLFLGTEFSLWVSLDRGKSWMKYSNWSLGNNKGYFPTVSVRDLDIHPRELDLIVGTHGRAVYIIPVAVLENLTKENLKKEVYLVPPSPVYFFNNRQNIASTPGKRIFNSQPGSILYFHLNKIPDNEVKIAIQNLSGTKDIVELKVAGKKGLNAVSLWDFPFDYRGNFPLPLITSDYRIVLKVGNDKYVENLHIEEY